MPLHQIDSRLGKVIRKHTVILMSITHFVNALSYGPPDPKEP